MSYKIELTGPESLIFAQKSAYYDGVVEGVRLMVAHLKQGLIQELAASRSQELAKEPPKES